MLKKVDEMPTSGGFTALWEFNKDRGIINSKRFYYDSKKNLCWGQDDHVVAPVDLECIKKGVFYISKPEYKKIEFSQYWQVERWLLKNKKKLYINKESKTDFVSINGGAAWLFSTSRSNGIIQNKLTLNDLVFYVWQGGEDE